jgi:1-acyl-sn-glycerol-3-phosphate acyltransferase
VGETGVEGLSGAPRPRIGSEAELYTADPTARRIGRGWASNLLLNVQVDGVEALADAAARGPTTLLCNHLSYIDTTAKDALIAWSGHEELANRLAAVAGPKVYADLFRRVAAAGLNTIPAPQSTTLAGTARLTPRDLARQALQSMRVAQDAMQAGKVVILYAEGSRSRTGRLRPFLKAVHRYLDLPGLRVVPAAITGTEAVFPVDATRLIPARVQLRLGKAIGVEGMDPRRVLEVAHEAVAALLPEAYRPEADAPSVM